MTISDISQADLLRTAPAWAGWIAQDADGSWWAYEVEPLQHDRGWYENEVGHCCLLCHSRPNTGWARTLIRCHTPDRPAPD